MTEPRSVVFLVDDDESVREGLGRLLASVGLASEAFPSGQAFLDARRDETPGCLVLEVRGPARSPGRAVRRVLLECV
ncbi:uncharacterized protein SOCE26_090630 [Sorangium cellulosum]|uniref:Response regulatory domain-containing protein n=1 Tax=Sorangium cellulosum TaxID=56 RepID=A0A2L0F7P8_SORCE|nr:response regulator [Sorangium cellulosum]AUX47542.1 uncharacterized protein SOCE26_090630 [Sorangium cellulosum]